MKTEIHYRNQLYIFLCVYFCLKLNILESVKINFCNHPSGFLQVGFVCLDVACAAPVICNHTQCRLKRTKKKDDFSGAAKLLLLNNDLNILY